MAENSADIAKRIILGCVAEGMTIEAACASAGKSIKTYEYYRRTDKILQTRLTEHALGLKDKPLQPPMSTILPLQSSARSTYTPAPLPISRT